jgi:hypothetical protein
MTQKPIHKLQNHPFELKKRKDTISKVGHAEMMSSSLFSLRCNLAQDQSQYVPLNSTCKKSFWSAFAKNHFISK